MKRSPLIISCLVLLISVLAIGNTRGEHLVKFKPYKWGFNCSESNETLLFFREKNGQEDQLKNDTKHEIINNTLVFLTFEREDLLSNYSCRINQTVFKCFHELSEDFPIDYSLKSGDEHENILNCSSSQETLQFYQHVGDSLKKINSTVNVTINQNVLRFNSTGKSDWANLNYSCRVNSSSEAYLKFNRHPQFVKHLLKGQTILSSPFRYVISFQPLHAACEWYKNGNPLPRDDQKYKITSGALEISTPGEQDSGVYWCHLYNEYGTNMRHVKLVVKDELFALGPFMAVLTEVVLLSIAVFIWERVSMRKKKSNEYSFDQTLQQRQNPNA